MAIKYVESILREDGFQMPSLKVLTEGADLSKVMLFQPKGDIVGSQNGVRSLDHDILLSKLKQFLSLSISTNADLLIAPEYCAPWELVNEISSGAFTPAIDSLWTIGFESITPARLREIRNLNPNIKWICEAFDENEEGFYSPLLYVFQSLNPSFINQVVIVVQFKTNAMVDTHLQLERTYLIRGVDTYIFSIPNNSIRLATIICSDALSINPRTFFDNWNYQPYILIHIQLNTDPIHQQFLNYRTDWATHGEGDKKHIICLNWASGTKLNHHTNESFFGRSCIFTKDSPKIGLNNIEDNHSNGMYYTFSYHRVHSFFFNFNEYIFNLKISKVGRAVVTAAESNFACPKLEKTYSWSGADWATAININQDYETSCLWSNQAVSSKTISNLHALDKEILINRAVGFFSGSKKSYSQIETLGLTLGESLKRLTFVQDMSDEAVNYRSTINGQFYELCFNILNDENSYPLNIIDFYNNSSLIPSENMFNLITHANDGKAIVCYLGFKDRGFASNKFKSIRDAVHVADIRKICIWYKTTNGYEKMYESDVGINSTLDKRSANINRE